MREKGNPSREASKFRVARSVFTSAGVGLNAMRERRDKKEAARGEVIDNNARIYDIRHHAELEDFVTDPESGQVLLNTEIDESKLPENRIVARNALAHFAEKKPDILGSLQQAVYSDQDRREGDIYCAGDEDAY